MLTMCVDTEYTVYFKIACPMKQNISISIIKDLMYIRENIDHFLFDMTEISDMINYMCIVQAVIRCTHQAYSMLALFFCCFFFMLFYIIST